MNPAVVEYLPIRQMVYDVATDGLTIYIGLNHDRNHVRPATDAVLNSAYHSPKDSVVVSYDPTNPEMAQTVAEDDSSNFDANIRSDESGSEDTVLQKRNINKRVLKKLNIISEKLKYFNEDTKKDVEGLIRLHKQSRLWNNQIIGVLENVATNFGVE